MGEKSIIWFHLKSKKYQCADFSQKMAQTLLDIIYDVSKQIKSTKKKQKLKNKRLKVKGKKYQCVDLSEKDVSKKKYQ